MDGSTRNWSPCPSAVLKTFFQVDYSATARGLMPVEPMPNLVATSLPSWWVLDGIELIMLCGSLNAVLYVMDQRAVAV